MKKEIGKKSVMVILALLLLVSNVSAVGLKWYTEAEDVISGEEKCILYGAYNPSSEDIKVEIEVTEQLEEIVIGASTEDKIIPALTASKDAVEVNFCFQVPNVYPKDCLIGKFLCEQKCSGESKRYDGDMVMTEEKVGPQGGLSGSAAIVSASTELGLVVTCLPHGINWIPVYVIVLIIILVIIALILIKKYRKPKVEREKEKLKKLKKQIEEDEKKSKKK
jgi:hypothetical protein